MTSSYPPNPNEPQPSGPAEGEGNPPEEGHPSAESTPPDQGPQPAGGSSGTPPQEPPGPPHQGQPQQQGPPPQGARPQQGVHPQQGPPQQGLPQQGFPPPSPQRPGGYPGYGPPAPTQQYPTSAPPTQQWQQPRWQSQQPHQPGAQWGALGGPAGSGAVYGGAPTAARSFFPRLFDLSFREFITPSVIKVLYVLAMIGVVFAWLALAISGFSSSVGLGLFLLLIVGPLYALFLLILLRVTMEFYVAVIRVAEDVRDMKRDRQAR